MVETICTIVCIMFVILALICNVPMFQIIFMMLAAGALAVEIIWLIVNYFFREEE